jgi:uncharacterized membrane protein YeaQ/YmgE (transglycosylase-associated protein family)
VEYPINIVLCMLGGGILGWLGYAYAGFNEGRGRLVSIIIGTAGGFFGAKMVAPIFTSTDLPGDFSLPVLLIAAAVAAAVLAVGNVIYRRWGM